MLSPTSMILACGIGIFAVFKVACFIIRVLGEAKFRSLLEVLDSKAHPVLLEMTSFFVPTHLIMENDIEEYRKKNNLLLKEIAAIETHKYIDFYAFNNSDCKALVSLFKELDARMDECNRIYHSIEDLRLAASQIIEEYRTYTHPAHYFSYSEMEDFIRKSEEAKQMTEKVFPQFEQYVTDEDSKLLPSLFLNIEEERKTHNCQFVQTELAQNKEYFDHVHGKYPLDLQQRESIVKLEDNCLVIASAGSGKTSTIVSKAKYLVEKQHISPSKILLLTYTKKAANELFERLNIKGINSGTFHSLAYRIIAETTGQAPSICNADVPLIVFNKLILENENFLHAINHYIINLQSLMKREHEYIDAFSYFEDRKKYGIQALFPDVDGKIIFTRSEEEKRICSILTRLGVMFRYECDYPFNTRTPERRQYKPDFTIYFKDTQGEWQRIYLEHFAVDMHNQVPRWFGEGTKGGWKSANKKYHEGIAWKRKIHQQFHTILIETTSADFEIKRVENILREQLTLYGVPIAERTDKELYEMLVKRNRQLEKTVFSLLLSFITLMKANEKTIDGLLEETKPKDEIFNFIGEDRNRYILTEIVKPFFDSYEKELEKKYEIDFTDAIIQATQICREGLWKQYDYILVDEFQDLSIDRYKLLQSFRSDNPKTKLYCVGDDWQSIFRFAGSDMALFYEFEKYFGFTEVCKIETTYRFHQPLIDKSSDFIMKNPEQKKKSIQPPEGDTKHTYINFIKCESGDDSVKKKVEEIVAALPPNEDVLLLGRYNYDAISVGFTGKFSYSDKYIKVKIAGRELFFLSVHSAKGLEADNVILVNCNQGAYGFPSLIEDDPILDFVLSRGESYPFAEERRLFYVAMTRAKKQMYVLYDEKKPSPFISEFLLKLEIGSYLCPKCLEGKIIPIKDGTAVNGAPFRSFICSNNEAGCDFFESRFGDLTSPGILITENMTAQDVEKMREKRRRSCSNPPSESSVTQSSSYNSGRRYIPNKLFHR